ncbi:putative dimethylallyl tryptophan synthase [Aspergillus clavatus NRRL 1]|uniref:Dimethylallyl tryptophan synthase, putative n=1 Tax=Aspergillus clavatus (strain ATCC 1007 / CBS 513.65 / DSM 816 / NCTC 3887 / NRRL 1 / QM 1276 / 107) TaxID=344612 RepID=A1CLW2_ASPCL|nr:dimethylallyl tryptophan synthase, putative [Aspergillus clavatus NRRL 1]EAW09091.1 dimethylallyl tryptophan synthase, putative [Aspergillus clavatus NRRL 1]
MATDTPDALAAYTALTKYIVHPSLDQHDWWQRTGPMLAKLLHVAKYPIAEQFQYLYLYATHLIPLLGPFPNRPRKYLCILGGLGALEFSQNFTAAGSTVRIAFDPTSPAAAAGLDPCNRRSVAGALDTLSRVGRGVDLSLYHALLPQLTLNDEEEQVLVEKNLLDAQPAKTQTILALDLKRGDIAVKLYLYPTCKAAATNDEVGSMVFRAIRHADPAGLFAAGLSAIEAFLSASPASTAMLFLSCDLVALTHTRFKLYLAEFEVVFDRIAAIWTLDGRLADPATAAGLDILRSLWTALAVPEGTRSPPERPTKPGDPPTLLPLLFNLEIRASKALPQPKIYIPLTGLNDGAVAAAVAGTFAEWGWNDHARGYVDNLASYKPEEKLENTADLQAWLSFSYAEETGPGLREVQYLAVKVYLGYIQ